MKTSTIITAAILAVTAFTAIAPVTTASAATLSRYRTPPKKESPKPAKEKKAKNIEICFFTEVDFKMTKHCVHRERRVSRMDDMWKDSIESITIDNASLKVCSEINLRGTCHTYQSNKHELPADLFDHIYSYRIR